ncbi:hypothetical protein VIGAN_10079200 [Vigna angularis var. angularis]|uniref:Uncharacterized protein n=1 Tax=Vigna angularis var. angularis TaxID=157739 RepID=A0A0S3T2R5_PHAAN|nr:hypothetical protein VIGAN_10079200 [Vigna angularis var. angularis]
MNVVKGRARNGTEKICVQERRGVSRGRHAGGSTKREDPVVMEAAPPITAKLSSMQKDTADWEKLMDVLGQNLSAEEIWAPALDWASCSILKKKKDWPELKRDDAVLVGEVDTAFLGGPYLAIHLKKMRLIIKLGFLESDSRERERKRLHGLQDVDTED